MKVWIGYHHYFNGVDEWSSVVKVFDDELKALIWTEEFISTETNSRNYKQFEVE